MGSQYGIKSDITGSIMQWALMCSCGAWFLSRVKEIYRTQDTLNVRSGKKQDMDDAEVKPFLMPRLHVIPEFSKCSSCIKGKKKKSVKQAHRPLFIAVRKQLEEKS